MPTSCFPSTAFNSAASMQGDRLRMRVELIELIAGTRATMARSRALLAEADAVLAREKLPLIVPHLLAWSVLAAEEITP